MAKYLVTLAEVDLLEGLVSAKQRIVEHEGHVDVEAGTLVFSNGPFDHPTIGYAPGQWLRFEQKEN